MPEARLRQAHALRQAGSDRTCTDAEGVVGSGEGTLRAGRFGRWLLKGEQASRPPLARQSASYH